MPPDQKSRSARVLMGLAVFTGVFMLVEIVGGLIAGSLALLADAGHMFIDTSGLMVAALAARLSMRKADTRATFGYRRAEVLGAFLNAILLYGMVVYVTLESIQRIWKPVEVQGELMLWVAAIGLGINLLAIMFLLKVRGDSKDMNLRAALLHVGSDSLGSVGAITAGILIAAYGWHWADAVAGLLVATLVAIFAGRLFWDATSILLQRVPKHLSVTEIGLAMASIRGVVSVHDIHIWSTAEHDVNLTAHVVVRDVQTLEQWDDLLDNITTLLGDRFDIHHSTIQPELTPERHDNQFQHMGPISSDSGGFQPVITGVEEPVASRS